MSTTSDGLIQAIGWALVQFLWQGAVIAGSVAVGCALFRRSASVRYLIGAAGLIAMLVTAAATTVRYTRELRENTRTRSDVALGERDEAVDFPASLAPGRTWRDTGGLVSPNISTAPRNPARAWTAFTEWIRVHRNDIQPWLPTAVYVWLAGVLALSLNLLRGWWHVERVRRIGIRPLAETWTRQIDSLAQRIGLFRPVRALESTAIDVPAVIGWLRPVLLLPVGALAGLEPAQLEAVIAHELAHVRRHDYLVNMLQASVETLLFFHPAVWWVSHLVRVEREHCCDDVAVSVCGDGMMYARALVSLEELRRAQPVFALGATDGPLLARVRRIVGTPTSHDRPAGWIFGAIALVLLTLTLLEQRARTAPTSTAADANEQTGLQAFGAPAVGQPGAQAQAPGQSTAPRVPGVPVGRAASVSTPPRTGGGVIRGRVVVADTGKPARRVRVGVSNGVSAENRHEFTDDEGRYEVRGLPAGRYTLDAQLLGLVTLFYGQTRTQEAGKTVVLKENETLDSIDFRLPRGGVIVGTVRDEFGDPVVNGGVNARVLSYADGRRTLENAGTIVSVLTDDAGEYRLYGLAPGEYYVSAFKRSPLQPFGTIEADSQYSGAFYPGKSTFAEAKQVVVGQGQTVGSINITLGLDPISTITGFVFDLNNQPLTGASVRVVPRVRSELFQSLMTSTAAIRPDGSFTITGVPAGDYELRAIAQPPGSAPRAAGGYVTIVNGENASVRLTGVRLSAVTGHLVVDPVAGASAPPLSSVKVALNAFDHMERGYWYVTPVDVGQDLAFAMETPPGHYEMDVRLPRGWMVKAVRHDGNDITDAGIELKAGQDIRDVEVEVTSRPPRITGSVRGLRGELATTYSVIVFAKDKSRLGNPRYFAVARPDDDGRYSVTLPAGDYYAIARDYVDTNAAPNPAYLERASRDAVTVILRDAASQVVDLRLTP